MSAAPAGYYTLHPRGPGASEGPLPPGYVMVSRWVGVAEARLWIANGGTSVPPQVGSAGHLYVTLPGAPRAGTDPIRIDFGLPAAALQPAGRADWRQIFQSIANTPIYNVQIHVPAAIPAGQITGRQ